MELIPLLTLAAAVWFVCWLNQPLRPPPLQGPWQSWGATKGDGARWRPPEG